jgi:hypothetical protein
LLKWDVAALVVEILDEPAISWKVNTPLSKGGKA